MLNKRAVQISSSIKRAVIRKIRKINKSYKEIVPENETTRTQKGKEFVRDIMGQTCKNETKEDQVGLNTENISA